MVIRQQNAPQDERNEGFGQNLGQDGDQTNANQNNDAADQIQGLAGLGSIGNSLGSITKLAELKGAFDRLQNSKSPGEMLSTLMEAGKELMGRQDQQPQAVETDQMSGSNILNQAKSLLSVGSMLLGGHQEQQDQGTPSGDQSNDKNDGNILSQALGMLSRGTQLLGQHQHEDEYDENDSRFESREHFQKQNDNLLNEAKNLFSKGSQLLQQHEHDDPNTDQGSKDVLSQAKQLIALGSQLLGGGRR